jgi:hypothetical protein
VQENGSEVAQHTDQSPPRLRHRLNPLVVFSTITLLLVVVVLAAAELFLQWRGFPYEPSSLLGPHFVDAGGGMLETDPFLVHQVETAANYQKFSRKKPPDTLRIAMLGGSSVCLLEDARLLKQWLVAAGCAASEDNVELLNLGVRGCGSDRAVVSARQVLNYEVDALLLYAGHNEFISESNYNTYRQPGWLARESKVVQLLAGNPWRPEPGRLYSKEGKQQVYKQFEQNLRSIEAMARDAGVPLVWGTVSANLALAPKIYDSTMYPPAEVPQEPWREYKKGIDLLTQSRFDEARAAFQKSIDDSPRPFRATTEINEVLRATAAELSVPLADVERRVIERAPHGIPGIDCPKGPEFDKYRKLDGLFTDHCHLNQRGKRILLDAFAQVLVEELQQAKSR